MLNKSTFFPLKIKICVQGLLLELDRIIYTCCAFILAGVSLENMFSNYC